MKNRLFSILISFPFLLPAQWELVDSGTNENLRDLHFPQDNLGYIVGDHGIVLKSNDAGLTWQKIFGDSSLNFTSVHFTSTNIGYAVSQKLYQTLDGGITWNVIFSDADQLFKEVYFVNNQLGFIGAENRIYRTHDGGTTWVEKVNTGNGAYKSIYFPTDSVGYFVGGSDFSNLIYKTTDGGNTLEPMTNGYQSIKEEVYFINNETGFLCGWYGGLLGRTSDGGLSWTNLADTMDYQCNSISFNNPQIGYFLESAGGDGNIYETIDLGLTWVKSFSQTGVWLNKLFAFGDENVIAVGESGLIYRKTGGLDLKFISSSTALALSPNPAENYIELKGLDFFSGNLEYRICNNQGQMLYQSQLSSEYIDLNQLASGTYWFSLEQNNHLLTTILFIKI